MTGKTLTVILLIGVLSVFIGCTKTSQTAKIELAEIVPNDIPIFLYVDLQKINADAILTKVFQDKREDFDYQEFKDNGFDPTGKIGLVMLDFELSNRADAEIPTYAILIPSTNPEKLHEYIVFKAKEEGEQEITQDGEFTVIKDEDGENIYLTELGSYVLFGMGEKFKDLHQKLAETKPENSLAQSPEFKESYLSVGMESPAIYAYLGGSFYDVIEENLKESMDTLDENLKNLFDMPDIEYAVVGGDIEQKRIVLKSYAKFGEDISQHPMVSMYLAELPKGIMNLDDINGDITLYIRFIMNFMALKELVSPYIEGQIDFTQFGMTEEEFWGMLRGDFQLMIGNLNMTSPEAGLIVGLNDKDALMKIMTLAVAGTKGALQGEGDNYSFTQGENKVDIEIGKNEVTALLNIQSFSKTDGVTIKDKLEEAGIENPDQYPMIFYANAEKVLPLIRMFAPDAGEKLSFLSTIVSAGKIEDNTSTGILIVNGSGENILEDILSSF